MGAGSEGGAEAADLGEEAVGAERVSREENHHTLACALANSGPLYLALLAVHELVAIVPGPVLPQIEHPLINRVAAR